MGSISGNALFGNVWFSSILASFLSIAIINDSDGIRNNLRTVCDNETSLSGEFETRSRHNYYFSLNNSFP